MADSQAASDNTSWENSGPVFDDLVRMLDVERKAQSDAENKIPASDATTPTAHENEFVEFFKNRIRTARNKAKDQLDGYRAKLSEIYHSRIIEDLNGLPEELATINHDSRFKVEQSFIQLRDEANKREMALKKFAAENDLNREPQPQHNPMQVGFWIMAIVLLETALNATFFAVGSDRGLLGGAIQAFVISFLNVMLAWFLGRLCLPQLNHVSPGRKYAGIGCAAFLVVAVFMLNMFAGHYRSALEEDAFKAVLMAVNSFRAGVMSIKSAQGWLLSAVGGVACISLVTKIYLSDDPYPGYGKVHRQCLHATEIWLDKQREFTESIINNYNQVENRRAEMTDRLTRLEVGYGSLLDKVGRITGLFRSAVSAEEGMCNKVVNHYRKRLKYYRHVEPPYFSQAVNLDIEDFGLSVDLGMEEAHQREIHERFQEYRDTDSARIKSELSDMHNQEIDNLDGFFGNV